MSYEWIEPKTNWQTGDGIHYTDYNRIRNNLLYVNDMLNEAFPDVAVTLNLGSPKTYDGNYTAKEFNRFNEAINSFARIGKDMSFGKARKYYDNAPFITAEELNRMENCIYRYKNYDTPITSIQINQSKKHYDIFTYRDYDPETIQLSASVVPYDLSLGVSWTSSDPNVVTVDENGLVTRVGQGTATITATANGSDLSDTRTFSVYFGLESISIFPNYLDMQYLETEELALLATPAFAQRTVAWSSSDPNIVSVDDNGVCTAVGNGSATITATVSQYGFPEVLTASIEAGTIVHAENVYIDPDEQDYTIHTKTSYSPETVQLTARIVPAQTGNKNVTWQSSNTNVVKVSQTGLVTRVGHGEAIVSVTTEDGGYVAQKKFIVEYAVNSATINPTTATISEAGNTKTITLTFSPTYAVPTSVVWSSSNTSIFKVNSSTNNQCVIESVGGGSATLTAVITNHDGTTITKTCSVTVNVAVTGVTISPATDPYVIWTKASNTPETVQLTATVLPANASNKNVTWSSSNTSVVKVDSTGLVTRVGKGTATITCRTASNNKTATKQFQVNYGINSVSITPDSPTIWAVGSTVKLTAQVNPSSAPYTILGWSSNKTSVATVDSNGTVTMVSKGSATITVRVRDDHYNETFTATTTVSTKVALTGVNTGSVGNDWWMREGETRDKYFSYSPADASVTASGVTVSTSTPLYVTVLSVSGGKINVRFTTGNVSMTVINIKIICTVTDGTHTRSVTSKCEVRNI